MEAATRRPGVANHIEGARVSTAADATAAPRRLEALRSQLVLALGAFVAVAGLWVALVHPEMALPFVWLLCGLAGIFWFAPLAYRRGHPNEGVAAALMTVVLGPISLLVLIPWTVLGERDATRGS
jgi:hypothetical protein